MRAEGSKTDQIYQMIAAASGEPVSVYDIVSAVFRTNPHSHRERSRARSLIDQQLRKTKLTMCTRPWHRIAKVAPNTYAYIGPKHCLHCQAEVLRLGDGRWVGIDMRAECPATVTGHEWKDDSDEHER